MGDVDSALGTGSPKVWPLERHGAYLFSLGQYRVSSIILNTLVIAS
jgi:hypothetical protein